MNQHSKEVGFWKRNGITLLLTVVNLIFTGIGLYYNYFRVSEELGARVISNNFTEGMVGDSVFIKIAVFNTGNRQAILSGLILVMVNHRGDTISSWQSIDHTAREQLPKILEPHSVALYAFATSSTNSDLLHHTYPCTSGIMADTTIKERCVDLGISWVAVNSEGVSFEGVVPLIQLFVTDKGVGGEARSGSYVDLFKH